MSEESGGESGRIRSSDAAAGAIVDTLATVATESNVRPVDAGLFAAATAVALWSWPHGAGTCEMCVPVEVA